ncbi:hypothetical protein BJ969_000113 [Saccharopolyspora gloriosae]|uniref:Uncharacterized protein n=1 Tax=Saccharopolyspora gloriosae TaxID=455344 RepID=A0A840NA69_9PSEU|nr:hypothetical protein [Saccharopolyspora gloriosae]
MNLRESKRQEMLEFDDCWIESERWPALIGVGTVINSRPLLVS